MSIAKKQRIRTSGGGRTLNLNFKKVKGIKTSLHFTPILVLCLSTCSIVNSAVLLALFYDGVGGDVVGGEDLRCWWL